MNAILAHGITNASIQTRSTVKQPTKCAQAIAQTPADDDSYPNPTDTIRDSKVSKLDQQNFIKMTVR
jgi:hypothetical protein